MSENPDPAVSVHQGAASETEADQAAGSETTVATVDTPRKKKRRKDKIKEEMLDAQVAATTIVAPELNETMGDAEGDDASGERKKKKKKKKKVKGEDEEMQVSATERNGSDSSGYHSDKPIRKRRRDSGAETVSEESTKSTKKKRKSGTEMLA